MAKSVLHTATSRGHADHGWLKSYHTFSFAGYQNPERIHFGALRVLNDDTVEAGMGFGKHHHENMEIISIPLEGDLEHEDSIGNKAIIKNGDIQVMSAGTGILHSEYNKNKDRVVKFLQIWVFPDRKNVQPRYDQITLNLHDMNNKLHLIVSPYPGQHSVWIHQQAWFYLGRFKEGFEQSYSLKKKDNGVYLFILSGSVTAENQPLQTRDGYGIWEMENILIRADSDAEFLIMEVPMMN